ncbi:MAG: sulfotransferase domain-containing protein [Allopontixanthobacter sediminis]
MNPVSHMFWLPKFIVIGAVKGATTWVQTQLQANPRVFLPDPEPHFFSRDFDLGLEHYHRFFSKAPPGALVGEKSADYLADPKVPERVSGLLPEVRLVAQLRDPVARAYSDYKMLFRRGEVTGIPADYLANPDNPHPRFLNDGLYGRHLKRWLDWFPREALLMFLFEDLATNSREVVEKVSRHIGVPPVFDPELARRKQNNSEERLIPRTLRTVLAPLKGAVEPLRGNPVFEFARDKLARPIAYPPLAPELERRMRDFYLKDIEKLESLVGINLDRWKEPDCSNGLQLTRKG